MSATSRPPGPGCGDLTAERTTVLQTLIEQRGAQRLLGDAEGHGDIGDVAAATDDLKRSATELLCARGRGLGTLHSLPSRRFEHERPGVWDELHMVQRPV